MSRNNYRNFGIKLPPELFEHVEKSKAGLSRSEYIAKPVEHVVRNGTMLEVNLVSVAETNKNEKVIIP
jgi:hypothetical protein